MNKQEEKYIDIDLLFFYFIVAVFNFIIYIVRHPLLYAITDKRVNIKILFSAYYIDLIIFLIVLIPYIAVIIILTYLRVFKKIKTPGNVMVLLFFPIFSFFTKGMSLLHVYTKWSFIEIFINNYAFFLFLIIGPVIVAIHKFVLFIKKNKKKMSDNSIKTGKIRS